jgi:hypothetical protein
MEHPPAAAVFINLPHFIDNPDQVQPLLDLAYADLNRNNNLVFEMVARVSEALRLEAELRTIPVPTEEETIMYDATRAELQGLRSTAEILLKEQLLLLELVGLLLMFRARSRAQLLPLVLLAAISAAVVLHVWSGGGVVAGSRSFVRFFILMLGFLFASNRPRHGG